MAIHVVLDPMKVETSYDTVNSTANRAMTPQRDHLADAGRHYTAFHDQNGQMVRKLNAAGVLFGDSLKASLEETRDGLVDQGVEMHLSLRQALDVAEDRLAREECRREDEHKRAAVLEHLLGLALGEQRARSKKQGKDLPDWALSAEDIGIGRDAEEPF